MYTLAECGSVRVIAWVHELDSCCHSLRSVYMCGTIDFDVTGKVDTEEHAV